MRLLAFVVAACSTWMQPSCAATSPKAPAPAAPNAAAPAATAAEASSDPEAGTRHLQDLLRRLSVALQERLFKEAEACVSAAEDGIAHSSTVTRSHPDFPEVEQMIAQARPQLLQAVELDRVARRNAAIDALIAQGEAALKAASDLGGVLASGHAQPPDIEAANAIAHRLAELQAAGVIYASEPRYVAHAQRREAAGQMLLALQRRAAALYNALAIVGPAVQAGLQATQAAHDAADCAAQLQLYTASQARFAQCALSVQQTLEAPGFDPNMPMLTALGDLPSRALRQSCAALAQRAADQVAQVSWHAQVVAQAAALQAATDAAANATDAGERERLTQQLIVVLIACEDNVALKAAQLGHDPKALFSTPFGQLGAVRLRGRCSREARTAQARLPRLHWRRLAQVLPARLQKVGETLQAAASESAAPAESNARLSEAIGGLQECMERSTSLLALPGADATERFASPFGAYALGALGRVCSSQKATARKRLAANLARMQMDAFAQTCHGDEIDVVHRRGVPEHIETSPGGRVFIYSKHGAAPQRIAFDAQGGRLDDALIFRQKVGAIMQGLSAALPRAHGTGAEAQAATAEAIELLEACQTIFLAKDARGFTWTQTFASPFGQKRPGQLRQACHAEAAALGRRGEQLLWQTRAETLRDRLNQTSAAAALGASDATAPAAAESRLLAAVDGFRDCSERATMLMQHAAAEPRFIINTALGKLQVRALHKACDQARRDTQQTLRRVQATAALQSFSKNCHGDEQEVARRLGLPDAIESRGPGRVFVYQKTRIAFDVHGQRIAEKTLVEWPALVPLPKT